MKIISDYSVLFNQSLEFVVVDLETTGLNKNNDRIIEIGAIKYRDGEVIDRMATLIDPGVPVPPAASAVNGIRTSMLKGKPSDKDIIKEFLTFSQGAVIVAHNASFDVGFINSGLMRMEMLPLENIIVDTVRMARKAFPGRKKYSQVHIAAELGIEVKNAHRAEDDARVCLELFTKCLNELKKRGEVPC